MKISEQNLKRGATLAARYLERTIGSQLTRNLLTSRLGQTITSSRNAALLGELACYIAGIAVDEHMNDLTPGGKLGKELLTHILPTLGQKLATTPSVTPLEQDELKAFLRAYQASDPATQRSMRDRLGAYVRDEMGWQSTSSDVSQGGTIQDINNAINAQRERLRARRAERR